MKTEKEIRKEVFERFLENPRIDKYGVKNYDYELLQHMIKDELEKNGLEPIKNNE